MITLKVNPREKEYLTYMLRGMKPAEIAEIMNITVYTACNYRMGILKKNRYTSSLKLICDWYIERDDKLRIKIMQLKEELSKTKEELRRYKNESKRRQRKNRT